MSDHNRGAYTPQSESPLAFDARRARGPAERPRSGALMISGLILLVLLVALAVFAVTRMGGGGDMAEVETYEAIKTGPEQAQVIPTDPSEDEAVSGMVVEPVESLQQDLPPLAALPAPDPKPAPKAPPAPEPKAAPTPAAPAPAPKPAPAPEPEPSPAPAPASSAMVQIGAFSSASQAEREWNNLALSVPADMAGRTRRIEPVEIEGETRYRALVGGFGSADEARAFCSRLQARGQSCLVRN